MRADLLQVKVWDRQAEGLQEKFSFFFFGIAPVQTPQQRLGAKDKLPFQRIFWVYQLFQLLELYKALFGTIQRITGDDLFFQRFDFQLILGQKHVVPVLRQPKALQNRIDAGAAGGLSAIFKPGKRNLLADSRADLLLGQAEFFPLLFDMLP